MCEEDGRSAGGVWRIVKEKEGREKGSNLMDSPIKGMIS